MKIASVEAIPIRAPMRPGDVYWGNQTWGKNKDAKAAAAGLPPDDDRSEKFLASEIIREKLFRLTGDELPYTSTVVIDEFKEEGNLRRISASIVVERDAHKGMVILVVPTLLDFWITPSTVNTP